MKLSVRWILAFIIAVGIAYIPNLDKSDTPKKRLEQRVIVEDLATITKFESCGNVQELKINDDLRHFCRGVKPYGQK